MGEQIHSVLTGNVWRLDVCQNAHHFAGINEPSNVQVPCVKGSFVFRITRMLLCVFHCSPWMAVTFCCPMKGNQNLKWADGSQWDCCPFSYAWRSMSQHRNNAIFFIWWKYVKLNAEDMVLNESRLLIFLANYFFTIYFCYNVVIFRFFSFLINETRQKYHSLWYKMCKFTKSLK